MWHGFPLHPETPDEGTDLDVIFARYPYPKEDMVEHLCRNARALNLPYGERTKTYNSRLAQEVGLWAQDKGKESGDLVHHNIFRAYFVDGLNLAREDVLVSVVEKSGLDVDEVMDVIRQRSYADAVDRDWARAKELKITAVPTFVIGEEMLVGAHEYRSLARFVDEQGGRKADTRPVTFPFSAGGGRFCGS